MAKKVQNQFSPGLRMSYQKRATDDSKLTSAHTSHIHKNRSTKIVLEDFIQIATKGSHSRKRGR